MATSISGTQGVDKVKDGVVGTAALAAGATTPEKSSGFPFTKEYTSPEQTITSGGSVSLTHGLGEVPKLVRAELVCKTADGSHSVGDILELGDGYIPASILSSIGHDVRKTSTTITITYGNAATVYLAKSGTGISEPLTNANWRLVLRAWA